MQYRMFKFNLHHLLLIHQSISQCLGFTSISREGVSKFGFSTSTYALTIPQSQSMPQPMPQPVPEISSYYDYGYSDDIQNREETSFATPKYSAPVRPSQSTGQSTLVPIGTKNTYTYNDVKTSAERWKDVEASATVQGNSLKTYSFDSSVERVELFMKSDGRPITAELALWQGPNNDPSTYKVYLEDGKQRTFHAIIETPGGTNSVAIRNRGSEQYPLLSGIDLERSGESKSPAHILNEELNYPPKLVQGGAVYTVPFKRNVDSIQISLSTDGCPMNAKIELLQGPDNQKQTMEVSTEDGHLRPFYAIVDTPGAGNVIRIVNTSCIEFPLYASIEPYSEQV